MSTFSTRKVSAFTIVINQNQKGHQFKRIRNSLSEAGIPMELGISKDSEIPKFNVNCEKDKRFRHSVLVVTLEDGTELRYTWPVRLKNFKERWNPNENTITLKHAKEGILN